MIQSINVRTNLETAQRKEGKYTFTFGDNLQENVAKFGEQRVNELFIDSAIISLQSLARRGLVNGASDEEIQASLDSYTFDKRTRAAGESPIAQLLSAVNSGKRTLQDVIAELQAQHEKNQKEQAQKASS